MVSLLSAKKFELIDLTNFSYLLKTEKLSWAICSFLFEILNQIHFVVKIEVGASTPKF